MKTEQCHRLGLFLYASATTFLFIYAMPFIFVGFAPRQPEGSIQVANCTVVELLEGDQLAPPTKAAVWFAEHRTARLWISIILIVLMLIAKFTIKKSDWREGIYQVVMWLALGVFALNFLALLCILVVN